MKKIFLFIIIIIIIFLRDGYSGSSLSFLNIGVGAGAMSIGNNGVVRRGGESLYWNPATMQLLKRDVIFLEHKEWIADMSFNFLGYIHPAGKNDFGIGVMTLTMPDIPLTYDSTTSVGSFSSYSGAIFLSYDRILDFWDNNLSVGISLKLLKEEVYTRTLVGFAGDVGLFYKLVGDKLKLGLNVKNLGPSPKFTGQEVADNLPLNVLFGVSYTLLGESLTISSGSRYFVYNKIFKYNFGIEYILNIWKLQTGIRVGYQSSNISYSILDNLTFGTGFSYKNYKVSYSIFSFHSLEFIHDISISVKF